MHSVFTFFIGIVKRDSITFVLVSRKTDSLVVESNTLEGQLQNELGWKTQLWNERQTPTPTACCIKGFAETENNDVEEPTQNHRSVKCVLDTLSTRNCTEAHSESMSVHSEHRPMNIVFDILREIVFLQTQRVRAGEANCLIKVKSNRGEPINERADTLAEEGRPNGPHDV
jgi:hypothetical protein